jgi:hypothetical protein
MSSASFGRAGRSTGSGRTNSDRQGIRRSFGGIPRIASSVEYAARRRIPCERSTGEGVDHDHRDWHLESYSLTWGFLRLFILVYCCAR